MGWSFYTDPSKGRAAVVESLRSPRAYSEGYTLLDSRVVGNHFWGVLQRPNGSKVIVVSLMASGGKGSGWGHKDMSEDMGPYAWDCPLSLLDLAGEGGNTEWRAQVRAWHAAKASRPTYAAGQTWTFNKQDYTLQSKLDGRRGWLAVRVSDGQQFRMPISYLARAEIAETAVPA